MLTTLIVALSLATAYVHLTLASVTSLLGLLFLANAVGFVVLALGVMIAASLRAPVVQRFGWAPRMLLAGCSALTIVAYLAMGPYFALGWVTKAVELGIIVLLIVDAIRVYGSPAGLLQAAIRSMRRRPEGVAHGV